MICHSDVVALCDKARWVLLTCTAVVDSVPSFTILAFIYYHCTAWCYRLQLQQQAQRYHKVHTLEYDTTRDITTSSTAVNATAATAVDNDSNDSASCAACKQLGTASTSEGRGTEVVYNVDTLCYYLLHTGEVCEPTTRLPFTLAQVVELKAPDCPHRYIHT
jgi:hypothetical protein